MNRKILLQLTLLLSFVSVGVAVPIETVEELVAAVRDGDEGAMIEIGPGTFALKAPLEPKARMTLSGSGAEKTIIISDSAWRPSVETLPDPEMRTEGMDTRAYLLRLQDKAVGITVSNMTLRGTGLHGAIFGFGNKDLHVHRLKIEDVLWSGIRTFAMQGARIHDCFWLPSASSRSWRS